MTGEYLARVFNLVTVGLVEQGPQQTFTVDLRLRRNRPEGFPFPNSVFIGQFNFRLRRRDVDWFFDWFFNWFRGRKFYLLFDLGFDPFGLYLLGLPGLL